MLLPVYLLRPPDLEALASLRSRLHPDVQLLLGSEGGEAASAEYEILVAGRPRREHLAASPHLRALIVPWAGIPPETRALMHEFPHVSLHNLHHNAVPVAEMAVALLLAAAKYIVPMDRSLRGGDWWPRYDTPSPSVLLSGKTALILGYGEVGRRVARACHGLGMDVLATRRRAREMIRDDVAEIYPPDALHALLPRAHAVVICLPQTSETEGLLGESELDALPPGALLVNVGRGAIVDERALYHALRSGTLHAAGLDVWYNYPADESARSHTSPSAYPFEELDNVVMSPHRAGGSRETEALRMTHLAELLNAAAAGKPLPNRVDLEAGY